jgi:hypothetical protein
MRYFASAMRRLTLVVTCVFGFMTVAVPIAQAGIISVERATTAPMVGEQRTQVQHFLQRDDVRAQLIDLGVDPQLAQARAAALSDAELARAADLIGEPAGAGAAGTIALIFIVLLITDILGYTDIFTFIRK